MVRITCRPCGAAYDVTTHHAPFGHTKIVKCEICDAVLDRFDGVTVYEIYTLVRSEAPAKE